MKGQPKLTVKSGGLKIKGKGETGVQAASDLAQALPMKPATINSQPRQGQP